MLADRTKLIDSSGIRKVFDLASKMKDPINLSIGQPDFDIPEAVKKAGIEAIEKGMNRYTVTKGIPQLRELILSEYKHNRGLNVDDIIITSGVSGGLVLAFMVLMNPGDEVIIPDPYFVMYKHLVNLFGGKPVYLDLYPDFRLDREKLESAITDKTKLLLLNSPCNPTGAVLTEEDIKIATNVARKHDLIVITDEIYEPFLYDSDKLPTIAEHYDKTLILNGFSKAAAMTGWRLGFAVGPQEIIDAMSDLQQYSFVCAPSFAQYAGMAAWEMDLSEVRDNYRRKRDIIYNGLKDHFEVEKPAGAFYIFPKAPGGDGDAFVEKAIANNVLIVPGSVFSERKSHFRLSFAATDETLKSGIDVLQRLSREEA